MVMQYLVLHVMMEMQLLAMINGMLSAIVLGYRWIVSTCPVDPQFLDHRAMMEMRQQAMIHGRLIALASG